MLHRAWQVKGPVEPERIYRSAPAVTDCHWSGSPSRSTGPVVILTQEPVMHDSNYGIGIDSRMIPVFAGTGIRDIIMKWNRNQNRNQ